MCEAGDAAPTLVAPPERRLVAHGSARLAARASRRRRCWSGSIQLLPPFVERGAYLPGENAADRRARVLGLCRREQRRRGSRRGIVPRQPARRAFLPRRGGRRQGAISSTSAAARRLQRDGGRQDHRPSMTRSARRRSPRRALPACACSTGSTAAIPVWPFDPVPASGMPIVEIYTAIAARAAGLRKGLQQDARRRRARRRAGGDRVATRTPRCRATTITRPTRSSPPRGSAPTPTAPSCGHRAALTDEIARTEGWTFGVD